MEVPLGHVLRAPPFLASDQVVGQWGRRHRRWTRCRAFEIAAPAAADDSSSRASTRPSGCRTASERLCFGIPGGLCEDCHQLYIDPELIELLDLSDGRCVFAIESDVVLQEEAWSSAD